MGVLIYDFNPPAGCFIALLSVVVHRTAARVRARSWYPPPFSSSAAASRIHEEEFQEACEFFFCFCLLLFATKLVVYSTRSDGPAAHYVLLLFGDSVRTSRGGAGGVGRLLCGGGYQLS